MKSITFFDKVRSMCLNCELYFTENILIKSYIDKYVIGAIFESIFYPNYFKLFIILLASANSGQLIIYFYYLLLLGGQFATNQITHFEGDQVRREGPVAFLRLVIFLGVKNVLMETFGDQQNTMNDFVKIFDDFIMQIFNNFIRKLATNSL